MARISISAVWDRTSEFMGERSAALLAVAAPAMAGLLLAVQIAERLLEGRAIASTLVTILVQVPLLWAQLQVIALAIDPQVTPGEAVQRATNRLPAALLLWLIMTAVVVAAMAPAGALLAASGIPFDRVVALGPNPAPEAVEALLPPGAAGFLLAVVVYLLVAGVALLLLLLRWALVYVVTLVEAIGVPAFARSWRLTRGMTLALLGVAVLYGVVALVAGAAARGVVGTLLGLAFGRDEGLGVTGIGAALAAALVATALQLLAGAFVAKFYLAARRAEDLG